MKVNNNFSKKVLILLKRNKRMCGIKLMNNVKNIKRVSLIKMLGVNVCAERSKIMF